MTGPVFPDPPAHPDIEIIEAKKAFERFLRMDTFRFRHRLYSGGWSPVRLYDVLRRGAAVGVAAYDPLLDSVVLVEQLRLPALLAGRRRGRSRFPPASSTPASSPRRSRRARCARKPGSSLLGGPIPIQRYLPSPGGSDESVFLFCARVDASLAGGVHGRPDEGEDIRTVVKTVGEIETLLDAGLIENGHTLVALYWLLRHREQLRRLWTGDPAIPSAGRAAKEF